MGKLPQIPYPGSGYRRQVLTAFGGLNHNVGARDGELGDMENLCGELYPVLSSRAPRRLLRTLAAPGGIFAADGLYTVDGAGFYADGVLKGSVSAGRKRFAALGGRIFILPDKKYYDRLEDAFGSMEERYTASGLVFGDGSYAGQPAANNSITTSGAAFPFRVGDAVSITGCTAQANNKTPIIREISEDRKTLRFYENTFTAATEAGAVTLARSVPDMDFLCEANNRLWGCHGDTIYASKLGDGLNWEVYDGLSTDSYAVSVGSAGDFTACASFLGYPVFFKEEQIYKVYGDKPSDFRCMPSANLGVMAGCGDSLAIAGETLFYLSRAGICAYNGGRPALVSGALGVGRLSDAVGGSDGVRYYVSARVGGGAYSLYVYDTRRGSWYREDSTELVGASCSGGLHLLAADGRLWLCGADGASEPDMPSFAEFGDFYEASLGGGAVRKQLLRVLLRLELDAGSSVTAEVQLDSDGVWRPAGPNSTVTAATKRSHNLTIIPQRCDHFRLRLSAVGGWRLYSLTREVAAGSER